MKWTPPQLPRPVKTDDGWPTRRDVSWYTVGEQAIREALLAVEGMGAHVLLTEAVMLLSQAQDKVADFAESAASTGDADA